MPIANRTTTAALVGLAAIAGLAGCRQAGGEAPRVISSDFSAETSTCQDASGATWTVPEHKPVGFACPTEAPAAAVEHQPATEPPVQQRFEPNPAAVPDRELVGDDPGEYFATCDESGRVANYWPNTQAGWDLAVEECKRLDDYTGQLTEELNRRHPGAGWH